MRERILEKLKRAEISLHRVEENTPDTLGGFRKSGIIKDGVLKNLEEATQSILDACALIIRELELGIPSEEAGFIDLLHKNGLTDSKATATLHSLRGLRNRLVHAYGTVDDVLVYRNIKENLGGVYGIIGGLRIVAKKLK